ncbi:MULTISPECIES: hypothetical protein [unclassified Roseofilum]|nr:MULTISPECIES: hypothetical protein [unclassified Roseofilum]
MKLTFDRGVANLFLTKTVGREKNLYQGAISALVCAKLSTED